jgi:endoglucanase
MIVARLVGRSCALFAILAYSALATLLALEPAAADETAIRLNTVGYLPKGAKQATVGAAEGTKFRIRRYLAHELVVEGALSSTGRNSDTGEDLAVVDFSTLSDPGVYQIEIDGVGRSAPFLIADNLYADPFRAAVRAMSLWRCGTAVSGEYHGHTYSHEACHLADAYLDFVGGGHERRPSTGGWHDAGDYNKYVVNSGVTIGVMLRAWEDFQDRIEPVALDLPEAGGPLPEFLADIKWQLDWLLTMQADDGSVYHKISTESFGGMILPEQETADRYFVPWGSNATAAFVAMMAQASRHFEPYDAAYAARLLDAAKKSYAFLASHPEPHRANQDGFTTGGYESDDWDDRVWADAELWETSGDAAPLAAFEARLKSTASEPGRPRPGRRPRSNERTALFDVDFDWGNVKNLGLLTYLFSVRDGRDPALVESLRASLSAAADQIVATSREHGYARPLGTRYYWGCNGSVARQAVVLEAAYRLNNKADYRAAQLDALNHLFGRNVYGRSFVTGLGFQPPMHPHDRRSEGDSIANPWPGYLVGGAHPRATDWHDTMEDYRTNEIAINWNSALIYALAAQLPQP